MKDSEKFSVFRVIERIGEGGMGTVYKVEDTRNQEVLALKLLTYQGRLGEAAVRRFRREFRAAARLVHPHIARVHDLYQDDAVYFTLEYVQGVSITRFFGLEDEARPLSARDLNDPKRLKVLGDLFEQVFETLGFIHDNQIVHRDIKPDNVFVTGDGMASWDASVSQGPGWSRITNPRVKILDFGLARQINLSSKITQSGVIMGTAEYMSPEQALGSELDSRSDLYSMGVLMYQLLTGALPFTGKEMIPILLKHAYEPPPPPRRSNPHLNPVLEDVILKLLNKDPSDRFQTALECSAVLKNLRTDPDSGKAGIKAGTGARPGHGRLFPPRFVGRDREMQEVRSRLNALIDGHGECIVLSGESGVGKTRLIQEIKRYCTVKKVAVYNASSFEDQPLPYGPFISIMDGIARDLAGVDPEDLEPLISPSLKPLAEIFPGFNELPLVESLPAQPSLDPEQNRYRLYESTASLLRQFGRLNPIVLCLDDMQWADETSLELIGYLVRNVIHPDRELDDASSLGRLIIILAFRDEDCPEDHKLTGILGRLRSRTLCVAAPLAPLDQRQTARFVGSMLGVEDDLNEFVAWMGKETGGNPFFIEECMKALLEEGTLRSEQGVWRIHPGATPLSAFASVTDLEGLKMPTGIKALLNRRLTGLAAEVFRVLGAAAAIGPEFDFAVLKEVTGYEEDELLDTIDTLIKRRLIVELEGDQFAFKQLQIRAVLLEEMLDRRRRRLHAKVGEALEKLTQGKTDPIALAYHFSQAGDNKRALRYLPEAGKLLKNRFSNAEAKKCFEKALCIVEADGGFAGDERDSISIDARLHLGDILRHIGKYDEALESYRRVHELSVQSGNLRAQAASLNRTGDVLLKKGQYREAIEAGSQARTIALELTDAGLLAEVQNFEGNISWHKGETDRSLRCFTKAFELREAAGEKAGAATCLNNIGYVHIQRGELSTAMSFFESSLRIKREINDVFGIALSLEAMGIILEQRGEYQRALYNHEEVLSIMRKLGSLRGIGYSLLSIGNIHGYIAEYMRALDFYKEARELKEELGDKRGLAMVLVNTAMVYTMLGHYEEAERLIGNALDSAQEMGQKQLAAFCMMARADVLWGRDILEESRDHYVRALEVFRSVGDRYGEAQVQARMGKCLLALARRQEACDAAQAALAYATTTDAREVAVRSLLVLAEAECSLEKAMQAGRYATDIDARELAFLATGCAAGICRTKGNRLQARELAARAAEMIEELAADLEEMKEFFYARKDVTALLGFDSAS